MKRENFLNDKERRDLRRAAALVEGVIKSVNTRAAAPMLKQISPAAEPAPSQYIWYSILRANESLLGAGFYIGKAETHDRDNRALLDN